MGVLEIICGCALIVCSLLIIILVTAQTEHGDGISGAIMGNTNTTAGKSGSNEEKMARMTKILAFVFFAIAFIGNIFVLMSNK